MVVPSRRVLDELAADDREHLGAVSIEHGFLPRHHPAGQLPPSHAAWDEAAAALPSLWRQMRAREVLRDLPLLSADTADLPDAHLWRASVVLSALAYSYVRCDVDDLHALAPTTVPDVIGRPWQRVAERLGRPAPHVAYDDIVTHNYRLIDPTEADPIRLENLHLLVPLLGNDTERAFLGVNTEIQAKLTGVVGAGVRAQEAVVAGDRDALVAELLLILECVRTATDVAFPKIDPNPHAGISCDPAVWAKLTAPTGIPIVPDVPGVSGAGSTGFQLVDTLLGRTRFDTSLGGEAKKIRGFFAPNCQRFLDAIEQVSIRQYVRDSTDTELRGLFQSVLESYTGHRGYLGVHRRKVYGFIQVAFKVGRPATASGISGTFKDRTWHETDEHLEAAREERYAEFFHDAQQARFAGRAPAAGDRVQHVRFDISSTGLVYRPGDRVAVLPEHTDALVERCVRALQAPRDCQVPLSRSWRDAWQQRSGGRAPTVLPLVDFLRCAELRPLGRRVAKALLELSQSPALFAVVENREEDQLELFDALELATASGYDVTRLWRAQLWREEALARIVPPAAPRMYSVAAVPDAAPFATNLELTVGSLQVRSTDPSGAPVLRRGTASTFLTEAARPGQCVNVKIVRPLRFTLPDPARTVVMFAGGTGIAPFRGFVDARLADPAAGPTILFAAARTRADLPHHDELLALSRRPGLSLHTVFSQEDVDGVPRRRIGAAMTAPDTAATLAGLLADTSGRGAVFYVCGQAAFAASVLAALGQVAAGDPEQTIRRLVGDGRLMTDLFTTFAPRAAPGVAGARTYDASDLVLHNDAEHGWWTAINGTVYDMTEFRHLHPGGFRIIDDNAGLDATSEYETVLHHEDSEIEALLAMYKIGFLRRLDLGRDWGVALHGGRMHYVPLRQAFTIWIRHLYAVVELQNSLRNDAGACRAALCAGDEPGTITPLTFTLVADLQSRMLAQYLPEAGGRGLAELWAVVAGLCDRTADAAELPGALDRLQQGPSGQRAVAATRALRQAARDHSGDLAAAGELFEGLERANDGLLGGLKMLLREGLLAFEQHEADTLAQGGPALLASLRAVPGVVSAFYEQVATAIENHVNVHV